MSLQMPDTNSLLTFIWSSVAIRTIIDLQLLFRAIYVICSVNVAENEDPRNE